MTQVAVRVIDVYPYRCTRDKVEFLLLRRSREAAYAGSWRMVGGKIRPGESAWMAGLRELREETAMTPTRFWVIPSVNTFYEWSHDRVNIIPAFAAEVRGEPSLDDEHDHHGWFRADAAVERVAWPEQRRLIGIVNEMLAGEVPEELIVRIEEGGVR